MVDEHVSWVSGSPLLVKSVISKMLQAIVKDPTRNINQIYEDVHVIFHLDTAGDLVETPTWAVQSESGGASPPSWLVALTLHA